MSRQSGVMQIVNRIVEREEQNIRFHSRQMMCDYAMIALGRLGWGEKRLKEFAELLGTVADEYSLLILDDSRDDRDIEYSKSKLDEELKRYCGKSFAPYEERYR